MFEKWSHESTQEKERKARKKIAWLRVSRTENLKCKHLADADVFSGGVAIKNLIGHHSAVGDDEAHLRIVHPLLQKNVKLLC